MIVTLDGRRLPLEFADSETLRTILDRVKAEHLANRLVVEVSLNGARLVDQALSDRLDEPAGASDQIDLGSDDLASLIQSALATMAEHLSLAGDAHRDVAESLQSGRTGEAVSMFSQVLAIWQNCRTTIVECSRLSGQDWTSKEFDGRTLAAHLNELTARLREIRDAFEARDYVLLGDLLLYEMPEVCMTWASIFRRLAEETTVHA